ncbi:ssDNA endonuclease and repair protein rad10 [Cladophialophora chaetospira]|uniref:SsDNA endonuclease and repair protein rad10 n=1 Tax=Cladophialophora chaetospira TaxID=386627 RepID=A0AA38X662_9EURO|nr:ssDNA endonuclease and repair protein rad10 [Cladophialophora chaetospira]
MPEEFDSIDFLSGETSVDRSSAPQQSSNSTTTKVVQPKPQALPSRQGPTAILVSTRQKGNPILKHVTQLPWEYSDIPCDYVLGATTCALFLSLKYHRLHPEYIYSRIRQLGKLYNLRILLAMVDIDNHEEALKELSKTSMINNFTLILCWSAQEAGRYLELFKSYEHASSAAIQAHRAETYQESLTEFVTKPRAINKTDAASLIMNFGSLRAAVNAQPEELAVVPGFGEKKVRDWYTTLREPFRVKRAAKSNAALLRQESTVGTDATPEPDAVAAGSPVAIPISLVPALDRQISTLPPTSSATEPGDSHKRSRPDDLEDDFDEDDEAALLALADAEAAKANTGNDKVSVTLPNARQAPQLSSGVAAALAKLRQNG